MRLPGRVPVNAARQGAVAHPPTSPRPYYAARARGGKPGGAGVVTIWRAAPPIDRRRVNGYARARRTGKLWTPVFLFSPGAPSAGLGPGASKEGGEKAWPSTLPPWTAT